MHLGWTTARGVGLGDERAVMEDRERVGERVVEDLPHGAPGAVDPRQPH
jgi:hypothetical protein